MAARFNDISVVSLLHGFVLLNALMEVIPELDKKARGLGDLMTLLNELCIQFEVPLESKMEQFCLTFKGSSKAAKTAKNLLKLAGTGKGNSEAINLALQSRIDRLQRWDLINQDS